MGKYYVAAAMVLFGIGVCFEIPILVGLFIGIGVAALWLGVFELSEERDKKETE